MIPFGFVVAFALAAAIIPNALLRLTIVLAAAAITLFQLQYASKKCAQAKTIRIKYENELKRLEVESTAMGNTTDMISVIQNEKDTRQKRDDDTVTYFGKTASIADVVAVVGDIATRTNVLAVKATIEAARPDECERRLAIVAHEVRKLARLTDDAAREINDVCANVIVCASAAHDRVGIDTYNGNKSDSNDSG